MQILGNIAEWCFAVLFLRNKQVNEGVHKKSMWPKGQNPVPLQSRQILKNIKDPIIMAADLKSLTCLVFSMHNSTFGIRESGKDRREKRTICLCCPLTICEWSVLRPRGLCFCVFFWCVCSCLGLWSSLSMMWCNLFCLLLRQMIKNTKKYKFSEYSAEKWLSDRAEIRCTVCAACVWCDCDCLYGVRDKTGCLAVM